MAAVLLFWDTNMAAVTSCENTLYVNIGRIYTRTKRKFHMRGTGFYIFVMFLFSRFRFPLKISRQIMEQNSSSDLHLDELSVLGIILLDRQNVSSINSAIKI